MPVVHLIVNDELKESQPNMRKVRHLQNVILPEAVAMAVSSAFGESFTDADVAVRTEWYDPNDVCNVGDIWIIVRPGEGEGWGSTQKQRAEIIDDVIRRVEEYLWNSDLYHIGAEFDIEVLSTLATGVTLAWGSGHETQATREYWGMPKPQSA